MKHDSFFYMVKSNNKPKLGVKKFGKLISGKTVKQIIKTICGEKLGFGCYRDVYVLKQNPDYVVKIERDPSKGQFANATEWRNYIDYREWEWFEKWLAPCELINETGQILIQRRVSWEGKQKKDYPKEIPAMFTDTHRGNFGWIGDRFVCCDYSFIPFVLTKRGNSKYKKARWR